MTNYNDIERIRTLDELCNSLGFTYCRSNHHGWMDGNLDLMPTEELEVYNTDMALCVGKVEELIQFLRGWGTAHQYLNVLGAATPKSIERKRKDHRNKKLMRTIKESAKAK